MKQPIAKWTAIILVLICNIAIHKLFTDPLTIKAQRSVLRAIRMLAKEVTSVIESDHPVKDHPLFATLCGMLGHAALVITPVRAVRTSLPFLLKQRQRLPELVSNLETLRAPNKTIEELVKVRESLREEKYPVLQVMCTGMIARLLTQFPQDEPGESIERAISYLEWEQKRCHELGLFMDELRAKVALGNALLRRFRGSKQQNIKRAIELFETAFPVLIRATIGQRSISHKLSALSTLAYAYREYGDIAKSLELYEEALRMFRKNPLFFALPLTGGRYMPCLLGYSDALLHAGDERSIEQAITLLNDLLRDMPVDELEGEFSGVGLMRMIFLHAQVNLGFAYKKRVIGEREENLRSAESAFRLVVRKASEWQFPLIAQQTRIQLGDLLFNQERYNEAIEIFREAIDWVEQIRVKALSLERRAEILRENVSLFERIIICLMKTHRYREALEYAERGKSRTLLDLLNLRDLRPQNVPSEVMEEYERLLFEARALEDRLRHMEEGNQGLGERLINELGVPGQVTQQWTIELHNQLRQQLNQNYEKLQRITDIVSQHDPDFLPHAKPLTIDEILTLAKDADATLVLFRVTKAGSFVFLVFPDGMTDVVEIPDFTTDALNELLVKFEDGKPSGGWIVHYYQYQLALARGNRTKIQFARERWLETMEKTLGELYHRLLRPVHERLRQAGYRSLVWVPN